MGRARTTLGKLRQLMLETAHLPETTPVLTPAADHNYRDVACSIATNVVKYKGDAGYGESSGDDEADADDGTVITALIIQ